MTNGDRLRIDREQIEELVRRRRHDRDFEGRTESEIRAEYIDPLFEALGWDVRNRDADGEDTWRREEAGVQGRLDYTVYLNDSPTLVIEAKPAGRVTGLAERGRYVDRTPEERQALRYTRDRRIPWAILTNFDRLLVFDAEAERVLLGFDSPEEYVDSLDADPPISIRQLSYAAVTGGSLEWLRELAQKRDVDDDFLSLLQELRLLLARTLIELHEDAPELQDEDGELSLQRLLAVVQRYLDRLILIRFADDQEILRQHDIIGNLLEAFEGLGEYREPDELHQMLRRLWRAFDRIHDTTIFQEGHPCEELPVENQPLRRILEALNGVSFRKFTADVLGATYESYLGTSLSFSDGELVQEEDVERRRSEGIFYTPPVIVRRLVDDTLGRSLEALKEQHGLHAIEEIRGLRVLDPACGSGSFLIYAFDVLANFYRTLNAEINAEIDRLTSGIQDHFERLERTSHLPRTVSDYPDVILTEHLYGVDLDPEAAEIATLNLVMRAFREWRDLGQRGRKLPLILNQNIKVGNSLVSPFGVGEEDYVDRRREDLDRIREMRVELREVDEDDHRLELLDRIEEIREPTPLEESGLGSQPPSEVTRPFDWVAEFPEVWVGENGYRGADAGFDFIIGNPPYIRIQTMRRFAPEECDHYSEVYQSAGGGNYDIYLFFVERSVQLLNERGELGFIVPNTLLTTEYAGPLRGFLARNRLVRGIVHFGTQQVFEDATTYTMLLFLDREGTEEAEFVRVDDLESWKEDETGTESGVVPTEQLSEETWNLVVGVERDAFESLQDLTTRLRDVARIFVGVQTSADAVYHLEYLGREGNSYLLRSRALGRDVILEPDLLRPLVSGTDVSRYAPLPRRQMILYPYDVDAEEQAVLVPFERIERECPRTAEYLAANREQLEGRESGRFRGEGWHQFGRSQNLGIQDRRKLCVPGLVEHLYATYDAAGSHCLDNVDVGGVILHDEYATGLTLEFLLSLLNSSLIRWYFPYISRRFRGDWLRANRQFLGDVPLPPIDLEGTSPSAPVERLSELAREMLALHEALDDADWPENETEVSAEISRRDSEIDQLVFELYDLSQDEIAIVEEALEGP